jgi:hypothetical protein
MGIYETIIEQWMTESLSTADYNLFIQSVVTGDMATFARILQDYLLDTASHFDLGKKTEEKFYHVFLLGLMFCLRDKYEIQSNRESGLGRCDIVLLPNDKTRQAILMELKRTDDPSMLEAKAEEALKQIATKEYFSGFRRRAPRCLAVGIAFSGKQLHLKSEPLSATTGHKRPASEIAGDTVDDDGSGDSDSS